MEKLNAKVKLTVIIEANWKANTSESRKHLKGMLTYDINKRISAREALKNPWIQKYTAEKKLTDKQLLVTLNNLKSFHFQSMFQAAVLSYISSQRISKEDECTIREIFDVLDKDHTGRLSKQNLIDMLKLVHGNTKWVYKEADRIFKNIDLDKNGIIEYNGNHFDIFIEFLVANLKLDGILNEESLRDAFNFYDTVN